MCRAGGAGSKTRAKSVPRSSASCIGLRNIIGNVQIDRFTLSFCSEEGRRLPSRRAITSSLSEPPKILQAIPGPIHRHAACGGGAKSRLARWGSERRKRNTM